MGSLKEEACKQEGEAKGLDTREGGQERKMTGTGVDEEEWGLEGGGMRGEVGEKGAWGGEGKDFVLDKPFGDLCFQTKMRFDPCEFFKKHL